MRLKEWVLGVCAALLLGLGARGAAQAAPDLRLYAMDCGKLSVADAEGFSEDGAYKGKPATLFVPCYLIRHPKGDLIWETGIPQFIADLPGGWPREGATMRHRLTDQLKQLGLTPADIEYVSVSHSHFDHLGNGGLFARSTWIVDPKERAYAFRPAARADKDIFPAYAALEGAKTILMETDAYDVFGDGSVTIVATPGHTPGHRVLLLRLPKAGPILLTGDMWHIAESRATRRLPPWNFDRAQTLASMDKVEALARDTKARVVVEHVQADFEALPKFPMPLR